MNVLFVCTGNICRSPMGEHLFRKMAKESGMEVTVVSAGVSPELGMDMTREARRALEAESVSGGIHRAQGLTSALVTKADFIFAMEDMHQRVLLKRFPEAAGKIRVFDVADPYGESAEVYAAALLKIKRALKKFLKSLK
jgi:protein-tyrosine phosphatase